MTLSVHKPKTEPCWCNDFTEQVSGKGQIRNASKAYSTLQNWPNTETTVLLAKNGSIEDEMIGLKADLQQLSETSEDKVNILENKLKRSWNELTEKTDEISLQKNLTRLRLMKTSSLKQK